MGLMVYLLQKKLPFDEAVFADTGAELPETYYAVRESKAYLKNYGIPLTTVKSTNTPLFQTCKRRKVIPSKIWRWSTRDWKIRPIHKYYCSLNSHIFEYLGIDYGEIERVKPSKESYITSLFPLVENKLGREDCVNLIQQAGLKVPIKSGCFFCPFHSIGEWEWIYKNHHDLYIKAMRLEESSKHFPDQRLNSYTLRVLKDRGFRNGQTKHSLSDKPCGAYCMA